jgi:hypothetical protein
MNPVPYLYTQHNNLKMLALQHGKDPSDYLKDSAVMDELKQLDVSLYKQLRHTYKCKMK